MNTTAATKPTSRPWPTLVALAVMWLATLANQIWVFGVLLLAWAFWDIATGESHFLQRVGRRQNPVTFWAIQFSWIGFGLLWILPVT